MSTADYSVVWLDPVTNVTHIPVVGLSEDRIKTLRDQVQSFEDIVIDKGDWSVKQLENLQTTLVEKFQGPPIVPHNGIGIATKRGKSQVKLLVLPQHQAAARGVVAQLTPTELGGVDASSIELEVGDVGIADIGPTMPTIP
jgi:hypothetical protein